MNREYHRWFSPSLQRDMELLVFGHAGPRMLVFPTSLGKYYEWEDRGMVTALADHIGRGELQIFCLDSDDANGWYARQSHPADKARRHVAYERYITDEVLPLVYAKNDTPYMIVAGASWGAYHAANLALRHPDKVNRMIGLSGLYDVRRFTHGWSDDNTYLNNPIEFILHEHDPDRLGQLRRLDIILATGHDDPNRTATEELASILWRKGIWNALRIWDGWAHDWPWWRQMIRQYIGGHD